MAIIYTDGSCLGNPGPGGWAAIILYKNNEYILKGFAPQTTNNRMEMEAAVQALTWCKQNILKSERIQIHTDSNYLKLGLTTWIKTWKKKSWRTSAGEAVKNQDLWVQLDAMNAELSVEWLWVKAHNGNPHNEAADEIARAQASQQLKVNR